MPKSRSGPSRQKQRSVAAQIQANETDTNTSAIARSLDSDKPYKGAEKSPTWWKRWKWSRLKSALETLGVVAVVVYAVITYLQWRDLRRNFEFDERSWIKVTNPLPGLDRSMIVKSEAKNFGKSIASPVDVYTTFEVVNRDRPPLFPRSGMSAYHRHLQPLFPNDTYDYDEMLRNPDGSSRVLTTEELEFLQQGKSYIAIYGFVVYTDHFGPHWTRFCNWRGYATAVYNADSCVAYNAVGEGDIKSAIGRR